ncbi:hypothetical protein SCARD494_04271 [Seiridium cardinale]
MVKPHQDVPAHPEAPSLRNLNMLSKDVTVSTNNVSEEATTEFQFSVIDGFSDSFMDTLSVFI